MQSASEEIRSFAKTCQSLVGGEDKNIAVGMAGLPSSISSVLNDRSLTFLNRAHKVNLNPLPLASVRAYYAQTFADMGDAAQADLIETVYKLVLAPLSDKDLEFLGYGSGRRGEQDIRSA